MDHDGHVDLLLAGNFDGFSPEIGRMTSSDGVFLRGKGKGIFIPLLAVESGLRLPGQTRDIQRIRSARGERYVAARNNDQTLLFRRLPASGARVASGSAAARRK